MRDADKIVAEAMEIVRDSCGEVIGNIVSVGVNSRAKSRWGRCRYRRNSNTYEIELSKRILADEVPYNALMSTAVHEVLHACRNASGHGLQWQLYAAKVMKDHPELKITRTTSAEEFGLQEEQNVIHQKYAIKCEKCGNTHYSSRFSRSIQHPEYYRCSRCHGNLIRIQ